MDNYVDIENIDELFEKCNGDCERFEKIMKERRQMTQTRYLKNMMHKELKSKVELYVG